MTNRPEPPNSGPEHRSALSGDEVATIAKALAHPARVSIVAQFERSTPLMAGEIVEGSELAQSTVSEHLRILREAGLLSARKDGPRVWYDLQQDRLRQYTDTIERITAETEHDEPL